MIHLKVLDVLQKLQEAKRSSRRIPSSRHNLQAVRVHLEASARILVEVQLSKQHWKWRAVFVQQQHDGFRRESEQACGIQHCQNHHLAGRGVGAHAHVSMRIAVHDTGKELGGNTQSDCRLSPPMPQEAYGVVRTQHPRRSAVSCWAAGSPECTKSLSGSRGFTKAFGRGCSTTTISQGRRSGLSSRSSSSSATSPFSTCARRCSSAAARIFSRTLSAVWWKRVDFGRMRGLPRRSRVSSKAISRKRSGSAPKLLVPAL
mmetsp:Transcript_11311/g.42231  ORF Transcript_11311/g.42231 Transcript_11311/m.42231 type:complete len:259 (+) Transcript_11311:600-1376(+)